MVPVPSLTTAGRVLFTVVCLLATGVASPSSGQTRTPERQTPRAEQAPTEPGYAPDEIIVRFRASPRAAALSAAVHQETGGEVLRQFRHVPNLQLVRLPAGLSVEQALGQYRQYPDVIYAEPNYLVTASATPDDTRFGELWGLHNTGGVDPNGWSAVADADIDAPEAWDLTTGSSQVVVGVIDSGIDYTHEDLAANMFQNTVDCNTNGVDDDGNGYVDDCYGIDTFNDDSDPMDDAGHGTHVSGTIGARGDNGIGVVGVNWQVQLVGCKFLGAGGSGFTDDAIECVNYFTDLKDRGVNLVATNNSWGGGGFSQALADAIEAQVQRGILFIAAAGNDTSNNDEQASYPANYDLPNIISVAATTATDGLARFSNFGRRAVHLAAPGQAILSTWPQNEYAVLQGTSMAAPHVTGVAALLKAHSPSLTWWEIKNLLLTGGDPNLSLLSVAARRLNAHGALTCSNQTVRGRVRPTSDVVTTFVGVPISLKAVHVNCAAPNGAVDVTVNPGGQVITLLDGGVSPDQVAGDGTYAGQYTPSSSGTHTVTFPGGDIVTLKVLGSVYSAQTTAAAYRTISGSALPLSDVKSATIEPPFPLAFGGSSFDRLFVSDNGVLTFDGPATGYTIFRFSLPTTRATTLVVPFWEDLYPPPETDQTVYSAVTGTAPTRELVVEWRNLTRYRPCGDDTAHTVRFQVVLFEASDNILFNYADVTFGGACGSSDGAAAATVGVQVASDRGTQYNDGSGTDITDGLSLLWTSAVPSPLTPLSPQLTITPAEIDFGGVLVDAFADRSFRVTNTGTDLLTGTLAVASPFEVVSEAAYQLDPGASRTVTVRFSPEAVGAVANLLTFESNAGVVARPLSGVGQASGCGYAIAPNTVAFGSDGGFGSMRVTGRSGCGWMATSGAGWITVTSGPAGSGTGSVGFLVSSNPEGSRRTGVVVVAGQAVTVTQEGREAAENETGLRGGRDERYVANEILVRFRGGGPSNALRAAHADTGALVVREFTVVPNLQLVRLPEGMSVEEAIASYQRRPDVLYAEPDYIVHARATPDDSRFGELWGLHNTGQPDSLGDPGVADADIDAPEAWNLTTGSREVVVGVIDSGVDYTHEDLADNMFRNTVDCNTNGVDDDGNGYVDDCYGIDTFNDDSDPMDDAGHGTHVSGTIGARGDNGVGVVGVNWRVQIAACKFLGASGFGRTSGAVTCLDYCNNSEGSVAR